MVPGRRTDWHECQGVQYLHSVGLLRAAFRPDGDACAVRTLICHRNDLVQMANQHIQHKQRALTQMNVPVWHFWMRSERENGTRGPWRSYGTGGSEYRKRSSRNRWRRTRQEEHLFTLKQSRERFRKYQEQIDACDEAIERL